MKLLRLLSVISCLVLDTAAQNGAFTIQLKSAVGAYAKGTVLSVMAGLARDDSTVRFLLLQRPANPLTSFSLTSDRFLLSSSGQVANLNPGTSNQAPSTGGTIQPDDSLFFLPPGAVSNGDSFNPQFMVSATGDFLSATGASFYSCSGYAVGLTSVPNTNPNCQEIFLTAVPVVDATSIATSTAGPTSSAINFSNSMFRNTTTGLPTGTANAAGVATSGSGAVGAVGIGVTSRSNIAVIVSIVISIQVGFTNGIAVSSYVSSPFTSTITYVPGGAVVVAGTTTVLSAEGTTTVTITSSVAGGSYPSAPSVVVISPSVVQTNAGSGATPSRADALPIVSALPPAGSGVGRSSLSVLLAIAATGIACLLVL